MYLELYPEIGKNLYYVEFSKWENQPLRWSLFKRQFICSKEEWDNLKEDEFVKFGREGHPWNLGGGIVNVYPNAVSMDTKEFLKFMVDSLNKNI